MEAWLESIKDFKKKIKFKIRQMSPFKIIPLVFLAIILLGTLLLMQPIASKEGATSFSDALFTATSATCVTGLIRFDTYTHWTVCGQMVILTMIQIGGIGFMSIAVAVLSASGKRIGLNSRFLMQSSISAPQVGGVVKITRFLLLGTFLIEGIGAVLLAVKFVPKYGFLKGTYFSVFHSVSAFCNAGFDLLGGKEKFVSLTAYGEDWYLNTVIMLLIILGGLGFFVWKDLLEQKFYFKNMKLHTKMVLSISTILILGGALFLYFLEWGEPSMEGKPLGVQILNALFQSVSTRTAGFNTIDLTALSDASIFVMICLMLVGGSPGSTAGGMKTTTLGVLVISIPATIMRKKSEEIYGRRLEEDSLRTAACIFMIYLFLCGVPALIIAKLESVSIITALFETASAIGTVGLTLGITPGVGMISKFILILLMYIGRVGSLTILMAFASERKMTSAKLPLEKIQIG